jgi:hypothetical protein
MSQADDLSSISSAIRSVVAEAKHLGASVDQVAEWSKATVVHMAAPMTDCMRKRLKERFSSLRYFRTTGDPHNPPDEGFFDDAAACAISFPSSSTEVADLPRSSPRAKPG